MAGDSTKIKLGAAWVTFGTPTGNVGETVDLGYTKGGITVTMDTTVYEITVDQEGTSPVAATILGRRATVDFSMAQSDYETLQKLIPESSYADGLLDINSGIGADLMDYADILVVTSKADTQDWITLYNSVPVTSFRATFAPDGERLWPVQFIGFIDSATSKLIGLHEAT